MPKNDELKAVLDSRGVTYDDGLKNAQLVKLVKETEGQSNDAPADNGADPAAETIDGDRAAALRARIEASQTIRETGYENLPKPSELHLLTPAKADELEKLLAIAEAADKKAAEDTPVKSKKGGNTIERVSEATNTWWCPLCDHSNADTENTCGGCRAERDGDKVRR